METIKLKEYALFEPKFPTPTGFRTITFDHPMVIKSNEALRVNLETGEAKIVPMKDLCCEPQHEAYMQPRSGCQYCKE